MKKYINRIKHLLSPITQGVIGYGSQKVRDVRDYETLEPEKFSKTVKYAVSIFEDNELAMDFIRREAIAYWEVMDHLSCRELDTQELLDAFKRGNMKQGQYWKTSFEIGDMHWQTIVGSLKENVSN